MWRPASGACYHPGTSRSRAYSPKQPKESSVAEELHLPDSMQGSMPRSSASRRVEITPSVVAT
jgi:hypothetical protein